MALGRGNIEIDIRGNLDTSGIARQVATAEKQIRPMNLGLSLDEKGFRQPLGRISGDIAEFQKSLDASVARTLAFGAAVGVINAVSDAFKALVGSAIEVEKALADINVILNLNGQELREFSNDLFDVAANTGQSFQTVSEAAVELSRQGLGAEETLRRINDAMILTRLSGMDAAKSVETLTAAVNSFGTTALTTTELVNKLASVDAAFAVSTEDLANGLARAGATAQAAKVDLNELLAAITSVQQTTARGGAVIGNAFKSIFTRLQRSGVREALEEIGVATTDSAGNIRGALDILQDYAQVYKTLSDSQKAYTDELVAGVFQINNLKALIKDLGSDYSIYQRALEQSNGATDEAIRRNEQLQTTLSALLNEASVNAKELAAALGELIATPAIENLLKIFNSIAGALNQALDPEEGSKLIKGIFTTIGNFISGPGLIIIAAGFIKLFKFITGQSAKALKEIFNIGSAKDKIADAEAKIGFLLKNNQTLYEAISNETLTHEQREELVLETIKRQNRAYQEQEALISRIASSASIRSALSTSKASNKAEGYVPTASRGLIPNYANGISGAIQAEKDAVSAGVGGASKSAKPKVLKNFPMGGGKRETVVANTDEVVVPKFGGGTGSAIFNQDMIKKFGKPEGAIPVSRGYVPNFAKSKLESDKQFQSILSDFRGVNIDVQRDISGFGMLSAKGKRGNLDVTKKPGFSRDQKLEIINDIGGSTLSKDDKNYLLTTIGGTKKTRFSNIPSQTLESADPKQIRGKVGALNDLINPHIADAVANVATNIYTKVLGDEVSAKNLVTNVRASANADKGIISVGAQGDIFESAIRLGSKESAKGLARDDRSAIWDFEETGPISADLKGLFFPTSNIAKADAKRSGDQDSAGEVVKKAYKNTFDEQLRSMYGRSWAPIVSAAVKAAPAKQKTERKRFGKNLAGGYIPNFATNEEKIQEWISAISKMKNLDKRKKPFFFVEKSKLHDNLNINPAIISKDNFIKAVTSNYPNLLKEAAEKEGINYSKVNDIYSNLTQHNRYKNINDKIQEFKSKKVTFKTKRDVGSAIEGQPGLFDNNIRQTQEAFDKAGLNGEKMHEDVKSLVSNEAAIKETRVIGNNFEEFVSTLGGQKFIQGPDAFDFAKSQKRGLEVDSTTKEQINMMTGARFGDAEKGSGHPREKFVSKTIRELAALGKLEGADKGKNINLNRAGNLFYDVVGKGRDKTEKVDLEFANFYNKSGRYTKEALRKAFAKRGSGAFGKDKQKRDEKLKGRLSSKASEETQQKYSAELSRLFDTETLQKNLQLTYKIDDIDPERLKVDKRTKRGKELSAKLNKYLESIDNKADGFIPNFFGQKINWEKDEKTKQWALSGNASELRYFGEYLEQVSQKDPKMVSPKAAAKFLSRAKSFDAVMEKEREEVNRKTPIGFGRQGRKHYDQMSFVSRRRRNVSIDGIFIKNLRDHVKQFNKHGSLFAADKIGSYDSFLADGYIPNFFNEAIEQRRGEKKKSRGKRKLDMSYFFPMASKGASALKAVYKDIVESAKVGRPYTDLDAGVVIGPRIPKLLFEGHRLLQQSRAKGVEIPKMKIDGYISPAMLMQKIKELGRQESEGISQSPIDYKSGEEKEVESYLQKLGLNPESMKNADIGNLPIFSKGFAAGFVPNFANQVYDKDKIPGQEAAQILQNILTNKKKKDLLIGPSGSGKTTLAQKYGEFIKSLDDVQEASSYTILSGAGKTKAGGMSPALLKIIDSVNKSGGKVSYLSVSDKTLEERREKRIASPIKGDLRSEGQLKGTRFAPKNQSGFADIIKSASNRFQIINAAEGMVPGAKAKKPDNKKPLASRRLDLNWISSVESSGTSQLRRIYKDIEQSAKAGKPYTQIDAGFVVGPRIPKILVEGQRLLNKARSSGKNIPKMKLNGVMTPGDITKYIHRNKEKLAAGDKFTTKADYMPGEEKEVEKYLRIMGLDPSSLNSVDLDEIQMFRNGFAQGYIPNFFDVYRGIRVNKGSQLPSSADVFQPAPDSRGSFRASSVYDLNSLHEYLQGHVDSAIGTGMVSSSTNINHSKKFATTNRSNEQGVIAKKSMSHKRIYNPKKVEKLVNFLIDRKGWTEAKAVQWFVSQAKNKDIGFHMKRFMDEMQFKVHAAEDEVGILTKSSFAKKDSLAPFADGFIPNFAKQFEVQKGQKLLPSPPNPILESAITEQIFQKYEQPIRMGAKGRYKGELNEDEVDEDWVLDLRDQYKRRKKDPKQRFFITKGIEPPVSQANLTAKEINTELKKRGINVDTGSLNLKVERSSFKEEKQNPRFKFSQGSFKAASGLIPNFANALQDAIVREEKALKSQGSSAKVYVDQDNRLKDSKNPMGLLVANRRDEPSGGFQGVNRAMSMGMNPKTHGMASGYIPNYAAGAGGAGAGGTDNEGGDSMGKMIAFQLALSSIETVMQQAVPGMEEFSMSMTQMMFGINEVAGKGIENLGKKMENMGGRMGAAGKHVSALSKVIGPLSIAFGIASDIYSNFFDTNKKAIRALGKEIDARKKAANEMSQSIEKIDQFAQAAAKVGQSFSGSKDAKTTAKFIQDLLKSGKDVASLDPAAFKEVVNALGDTDKFNEAVQNFKNVANAGKDVNQFGTDILAMAKSIREQDLSGERLDDSQLQELQEATGMTFENMAKSLTKNLSPEKIKELSKELQYFNAAGGNASEKLIGLESVFGPLDAAVKTAIENNESLAAAVVQNIKAQSDNIDEVNDLGKAMVDGIKPTKDLSGQLNELAQGMLNATQNTKAAIDVLSETGKIQAKSDLDTMQATTTVSQEDLLGGQAASDIKNGLMLAAKEQEGVLNSFAAKLIQQSKEGTVTLSGEMKSLIASISSGSASPEEAIKSLINIQKTGSPEEKQSALETIAQLKGISQNQIKNAAITNANLQAQLRALDAQAIAFQRNNILSTDQLKNLGNINGLFQNQSSLLKSQLDKLGEVRNAIDLIEDLGGSSDIIAALKEENKQETQFENLQSAFEQLSGTTSGAADIEALNREIFSFDLSKVEGETASLIVALNEAVAKAAEPESEGGVSTQEDVEEVTTLTFEENEINDLADAMGNAVSSALAKNLGIGPELAAEVNKAIDTKSITAAIEKTAAENAVALKSNKEFEKTGLTGFTDAFKKVDFKKLDSATSNLEATTRNLNEVTKSLQNFGAASGFVPNFAPIQPVERALNTERAMGAKRPVVDTHPSIGTYVRDGATQPNFSAVRRDHPEGITKAIGNSRSIQGANARGFIPNFAPAVVTSEEQHVSLLDKAKNLVTDNAGTAGSVAAGSAAPKAGSNFLTLVNQLKELGFKGATAKIVNTVAKGGIAGGVGFAMKKLTNYVTGDVMIPSDERLINSIYFGAKNKISGDVPPFISRNKVDDRLKALDMSHFRKGHLYKQLPKGGPYTPQSLDTKAIEILKPLFESRQKHLFDLSRGNISGLKKWGRQHERNETVIEYGQDASDFFEVAADYLGLAAAGLFTIAPFAGPKAPAVASLATMTGIATGISYAISSMADIVTAWYDTGIAKAQIDSLSKENLTGKLTNAMGGIFPRKAPQGAALFPQSVDQNNTYGLKGGAVSFELAEALKQIEDEKAFKISAAQILDSDGNLMIPIKYSGAEAREDKDVINLGLEQVKIQGQRGHHDLSKQLVQAGFPGSANFYANLEKVKEFEETLGSGEDMAMRVPFSFKGKLENTPTKWTAKEMKETYSAITSSLIQNERARKLITGGTYGAVKYENSIEVLQDEIKKRQENKEDTSGLKVKLEDHLNRLGVLRAQDEELRKAAEGARNVHIGMQTTIDSLNRDSGKFMYDRLYNNYISIPHPTDPLASGGGLLRVPDAPTVSMAGSRRTIFTDRGSKLSEVAQAAIDGIKGQSDIPRKNLEDLVNMNFSEFLSTATLLNPEGVSDGITSAMRFLKIQKEDLIGPMPMDTKRGGEQARPTTDDAQQVIDRIQEEQKIIDKFAGKEDAGEITTAEDKILLGELIGQQGIDANEAIQKAKANTEDRNIRNALYLVQLGKWNTENRKSYITDARARIKRIEESKGTLNKRLSDIINTYDGRINIIKNRGQKFPSDAETIAKFEEIKQTAKQRQDLYQTAEGTKFLYFAQRMRGMPDPIYQSPQNYAEKFNEIESVIKMERRGVEGVGAGELLPGKHTKEKLDLFAMAKNQQLNRGKLLGQAFESNFEKADVKTRRGVLRDFGLAPKTELDLESIADVFEGKNTEVSSEQMIENVRKSLKAYSGGGEMNAFGILANEILNHVKDEDQKAIFINAIGKTGIPFTPLSDIDNIKNETVKIKHPLFNGGQEHDVPALDNSDIEGLKIFAKSLQMEDAAKAAGVQKGPNVGDQLNAIMGQVSREELYKSPVFVSDSELKRIAGDISNVKNGDLWKKKYHSWRGTNQHLFQDLKIDGYGNFNFDGVKFFEPPGKKEIPTIKEDWLAQGNEVTPGFAAQTIVGSVDHGKNELIENLLVNSLYPFPNLKVENWENRVKSARGRILEKYQSEKFIDAMKSYAPFGYTTTNGVDTPSGMPGHMSKLAAYLRGDVPKSEDQANARGFVPNFSAVAGEIAASKVAGYKKPVTPSQVKSMNIPGVGKTSYNTQESVFKLSGMSQPFIAPPSNSKAAKSYANTVQKKFNFNPYTKAADGFVPNFAPNQRGADTTALDMLINSFSSIAERFSASTTVFQEAISNLSFQEFVDASEKILESSQASETQSNSLKEAASLIQQGASALTEGQAAQVDFSALTSAASTIQSSFESLSTQLSQPITINTENIEGSMSTLSTALSNVQGTLQLSMPSDINVNVSNSAEAIASQIKKTIEDSVTQEVALQLSKQNFQKDFKEFLNG